jgi:hypothetical protein
LHVLRAGDGPRFSSTDLLDVALEALDAGVFL